MSKSSAAKKSIIVGGLIGTGGLFVSKLIGLAYTIPFSYILQSEAYQSVYAQSYNIYAYLLTIFQSGVPFAVATLVARYIALEDAKSVILVKKIAFAILGLTGFVGMILLFTLSNVIAPAMVAKNADIMANCLKILSLAIFLVPVLSAFRGYYQGLKEMEEYLTFKYKEIVADAGYESEENYLFIEGNGQTAYIKPQNYEISKTRKYKKDISRRENMEYHADRDSYICRNGRELTVTNERRSKTASGYVSVKTYYRSPDCTGCPYKTECIKGNNCKTPMKKRNKVLMVSKTMSQKRAEDLERITSEYGTMLRMNRSIQAEGSFADVKEDMNFRRYLYRGKANALAESILLAMGRNINKLHCKIQTGRTGSHLFSLKTA